MRSSSGKLLLAIVAVVAGVGLFFAPAEALLPLRALVRDLLRPGQTAIRSGLTQCRERLVALAGQTPQTRLREVERELEAVRLENRRLAVEAASWRAKLDELSARQGLTPVRSGLPPLITPRLVEARVLGEETAGLWRARKLVAAGSNDEIAESALVLDDPKPLIDLGADADLLSGDAVYAGRIVIGKIAEVGRYSSTLRLVTDPAYIGRARLARKTSRGLVFGAEGTLVGDGSALCRLKHISEPVNVGDEVFTGGTDGAVAAPMYYGKVVRAELEPGAREWSVWVEPAATSERLESVLILRRAVNSDRILAN